jgi:chromosome segregation ATPase
MTSEEIERILQTVAQNQARADQEFAMLLKSQNRYEERLATISDIMHDLADKQLKNEELFAETDKRFAQLADAQMRYEGRLDQMEASYQLFEEFVRDFRNETNDRFGETDKRLAALAGAQAKTDESLAALAEAQAKTDEQMKLTGEQIKALSESQARTDELFRLMLDSNGSAAAPKTKAKKAKKAGKKGSAK